MASRTTLTAAALLMGGAVLASRFLGYARAAYIAAFTVPDFLNHLLAGGALSITFVPVYTGYLVRGERAEGERVFQTVVTVMALAMTAGVVVLHFLTPYLVPRLVPAFDAE